MHADHKLPAGLSPEQVAAHRAADGWNELDAGHGRSLLRIAGDVAREPMFLLLLAAGSIYLLMGSKGEALILLSFVGIIMGVTVLQEHRTERALDALRDLSSPRALVLRGGAPVRIAGREVVREDVLILTEGDRVPADAVLLSAHDLSADESLLTGESVAVLKTVPTGDGAGPESRVFAGTMLTGGQGVARVSATGSASELGRIGKSLQAIGSDASPLQQELATLARRLAVVGIALCLGVTLLHFTLRGGWLDGLLAGITLAMGILPQEFPVVLIVFLAFGARRIAANGVLTRKLSAIETLGATTVLCVDKTGTLTENRMAVAALVAGDQQIDFGPGPTPEALPEHFHALVEYAVLASETQPHDPMEQAVQRLARTFLANTEHLHPDWNLAHEYELSPGLLAMSHLWRSAEHDAHQVATKGAPEAIADLCHLPPGQRARVAAQSAALAGRGLRVLGVARALHRGNDWPSLQHDFELEFLGLVGLADPLRPEVPAAIAQCRQAGIRVVMITGDHPVTARAIAAQAGIDASGMLAGVELAGLSPTELAARVGAANVFARVTPQQKLVIVDTLKGNGEVVAMTGDGVNDAPALKSAHIGIAMGRRGTDVAREAAAVVLLEDDFGAIVKAIRLGRRIFGNLRQAMIYIFAVHMPIIGLSVLPLLFGLPLVLAPIHIAFLELVIDPACSVVFEAEEADADVMRRPPRRRDERLVSVGHILFGMLQGALATVAVAGLYWLALVRGMAAGEARTLAFVALVTANAILVFSSRPGKCGLAALYGANPLSYQVLAVTLLCLAAVTCISVLAAPFGFAPLAWWQWLGALALGCAMFAPFEAAKWLRAARQRPVRS